MTYWEVNVTGRPVDVTNFGTGLTPARGAEGERVGAGYCLEIAGSEGGGESGGEVEGEEGEVEEGEMKRQALKEGKGFSKNTARTERKNMWVLRENKWVSWWMWLGEVDEQGGKGKSKHGKM